MISITSSNKLLWSVMTFCEKFKDAFDSDQTFFKKVIPWARKILIIFSNIFYASESSISSAITYFHPQALLRVSDNGSKPSSLCNTFGILSRNTQSSWWMQQRHRMTFWSNQDLTAVNNKISLLETWWIWRCGLLSSFSIILFAYCFIFYFFVLL